MVVAESMSHVYLAALILERVYSVQLSDCGTIVQLLNTLVYM